MNTISSIEIEIVPKSRRAKNRVREHGSQMLFMRYDNFEGKPAILVKSLDRNWIGWFTNDDIQFKSFEKETYDQCESKRRGFI